MHNWHDVIIFNKIAVDIDASTLHIYRLVSLSGIQ
jgi:hypothetical protein